jgi:hypothetical protein
MKGDHVSVPQIFIAMRKEQKLNPKYFILLLLGQIFSVEASIFSSLLCLRFLLQCDWIWV